jgi:AraC-like DNA-binding protein
MKADARRLSGAAKSTSGAYLRLLTEIVAERGIDPGRVLQGTQLTLEQLAAPDTRITAAEGVRAVSNAVQLTGDPGLSLELGLRTRPTAHGYLGYAVLSCDSFRHALEITLRYMHLRQRNVTLSLGVSGATAVLQADEVRIRVHRQFFLETLFVGVARVAGLVLGEAMLDCELCFDQPEPAYVAPYRSRLPRLRFRAPAVQIRFDASLLARRPVMADPAAARLALEQCEREQVLIGLDSDDIVGQVRAQLVLGDHGYPDLGRVASRLSTSARTLKRRLQLRGSSFQALLDQARQRDALRLLNNPDLQIQHVATALGYSNPPSFTRAFQRWTGQLPSQLRSGPDRDRTGTLPKE